MLPLFPDCHAGSWVVRSGVTQIEVPTRVKRSKLNAPETKPEGKIKLVWDQVEPCCPDVLSLYSSLYGKSGESGDLLMPEGPVRSWQRVRPCWKLQASLALSGRSAVGWQGLDKWLCWPGQGLTLTAYSVVSLQELCSLPDPANKLLGVTGQGESVMVRGSAEVQLC